MFEARLKDRLANLGLSAFNPRLASHNKLFVQCNCESCKMASPAISRKARKQNFSASEIAVLTEKVEENLSLIQSKFTNSVTNQKKK